MLLKHNNKSLKVWNVALIIALVFGAYFLRDFIALMIFAVVMAFLFNSTYQKFLKKGKNSGTAAYLTFVFSLVVIIVPVAIILFIAGMQIRHLLEELSSNPSVQTGEVAQNFLDFVNGLLSHLPTSPQLTMDEINQFFNELISKLANSMLDIISSSVGGISSVITGFIIYIYLFANILMHQEKLLEVLKQINPLGREMTDFYLAKMGSMTKAMTKGQFIIAGMQGLESAVVLYIAGFHSLFLFFLLVLSFLSVIPLGAGIVTIPIGIVMILTGNVWQGVMIIANHLLVVTNIDNVVRPRLVPKTSKLNSALTILSVFAGLAMFGLLGVITGPVIMICIVSTIQVYLERINPSKN